VSTIDRGLVGQNHHRVCGYRGEASRRKIRHCGNHFDGNRRCCALKEFLADRRRISPCCGRDRCCDSALHPLPARPGPFTERRLSIPELVAGLEPGGRGASRVHGRSVLKEEHHGSFYVLIGTAVLLLGVAHGPVALWIFTIAFGFSMGADYMLIPLVAKCFGTVSLGKLLALIIMGYSLGQWGAPWVVGRIFDAQHSYDLAWRIMAVGHSWMPVPFTPSRTFLQSRSIQ
jgi:hypothetical protein